MKIVQIYIQFWLKILDFKGVASRKQFWIPFLINAITPSLLRIMMTEALNPFPWSWPLHSIWKMNIISIIADMRLRLALSQIHNHLGSNAILAGNAASRIISLLFLVFAIAMFLANLSITVRRIRDAGFNPLLFMLIFIALLYIIAPVGVIFIFIILIWPTSLSSPKASKFYNYNNYDDDEWTDQ